MSDLKYRSNYHLHNTIDYERQRMNTARLRIEYAEGELKRRQAEGFIVTERRTYHCDKCKDDFQDEYRYKEHVPTCKPLKG